MTSSWVRLALGVALGASSAACGEGIYGRNAIVDSAPRDAGTEAPIDARARDSVPGDDATDGPGGPDGGEPDAAGPSDICRMFDAMGGELSLPDARLVIPSHAVSRETKFCLRRLSPGPRASLVPLAFELSVDSSGFENLLELEVMVTLPSQVAPETVRLAYAQKSGSVTEWIPFTREPEAPLFAKVPWSVFAQNLAQVVPVRACTGAKDCPSGLNCRANVCQ